MSGVYIKNIKGKTQILLASEYYKECNGFDLMRKLIRCIKDMSGGTFLAYSSLRGVVKFKKIISHNLRNY